MERVHYINASTTAQDIDDLDLLVTFDPFEFHTLKMTHHVDCIYETSKEALDPMRTNALANRPTTQALAGLPEVPNFVSDPSVFMTLCSILKAVFFNTRACLLDDVFNKTKGMQGECKGDEDSFRLHFKDYHHWLRSVTLAATFQCGMSLIARIMHPKSIWL